MASMQEFIQRQKSLTPILNKIVQYGILEVYQGKYMHCAFSAINNSHKIPIDSIYVTKYNAAIDNSAFHQSINFIIKKDECIFNKEFDIDCGFYFCEILEEENIHRYIFFAAENYGIYDDVVNNIQILKEFIELFKFLNSDILTYFAEHTLDGIMFKEPNCLPNITSKEIFETCVNFIKQTEHIKISDYEWFIIQLKSRPHLSSQSMCKMLNISKSELEQHSKKILNKINMK